jgi:hypothetical protein
MFIYVNQASKRKSKKPDAKARMLKASWEKILRKYDIEPSKKSNTRSTILHSNATDYRRTELDNARSLDTGGGVAPKKDIQKYTGDAMIGIGQLHKSNAIPIFQAEDAVDISKMRRG